MELTEKTSNLMLSCAFLLVRSGKAPLAKALGIVPLSHCTRRLADRLALGLPLALEPARETGPAEVQELEHADNENRRPLDSQLGQIHPIFGSRHLSKSALVTEIQTRDMRLRCPVCWNEATVALDTWQTHHLRVRGHLELYCRYCGTNSLWKPAELSEIAPSEIVI